MEVLLFSQHDIHDTISGAFSSWRILFLGFSYYYLSFSRHYYPEWLLVN